MLYCVDNNQLGIDLQVLISRIVHQWKGPGPVHTGRVSRFAHKFANLRVNPLMLLATCVNTSIYCSVFHNLHARVARCSASCVNGF